MDIRDMFRKYGESLLKTSKKYAPTNTHIDLRKKEYINNEDTNNENTKSTKSKASCQTYENEFVKTFKQLTYDHSAWQVWSDFVTMFACAISNPLDKCHFKEREELYLKTIQKYRKKERVLFPALAATVVMALENSQEQDFLGKIYMNLDLGNRSTSQFFTPYNVCQLMADITIGDAINEIQKKGFVTINDPCCGAGATLIAGINTMRRYLEKKNMNFQNHVLVVAQDIDFTVAMMCYIQLSLLGVAGYVKVGNSLTDPISITDTTENYWFTPMYFSDIWTMRRKLKHLYNLFEGDIENGN